jgi:small conductance mechanosensitive channel
MKGDVMDEQLLIQLQEWVVMYGLKIIAAVAILVLGRIGAGIIRSALRSIMNKRKVDPTLVSFVTSVAYVAIMAFVIIAAIAKLGMQTASFVAVLGAAGLAVGLALQGSLANFASGVLMLIFKPIKIGDYVEAGGAAGSVKEIGVFTTVLTSPDNKRIIVPNAKLTGDNIVNYSAEDTRRVDIVAGIGYGDDIDKARSVLERILASDERILKNPAPTVAVVELADSSVNFVVRPWVKTADYWDVFFATQEKIKKSFDTEGVSIPFPQQDVHLHRVN